MRNYRNALAALVFVFALSAPAFADDGVMHTGNPDPSPTPVAASTTQTDPSDGVILTGVTTQAAQPTVDLTSVALSLLQTLALI